MAVGKLALTLMISKTQRQRMVGGGGVCNQLYTRTEPFMHAFHMLTLYGHHYKR